MADTVQRIKDKLSIVDVISPYVKLARAGKYWKGLSPFNKEKTPSFYVNPDRGSYYCFSSSQGGDMFTFIEKMEGVDFKGAMKILAEKAGVEIVYEGKGNKEKSDRLRDATAKAAQYFVQNLGEDTPAYKYALSRGLTPKTIRDWGIGYAREEWRALLDVLSQEGYTAEEMAEAGLIKEADGKPGTFYDRFRNRLMFPIRDGSGRIVAFTGRSLDPNDQAKYLNSPETELFKKSQILFAMDRAKDAVRTRGFALLMEGQMDVLHAHQAGFENAVALSGTALGTEHLSLIRRYSDNLMLCLDGDRAGLAATFKHAVSALRSGLRVKAVRLPLGKDPADLISEDPKEFAECVRNAKPIVTFFLQSIYETEKSESKQMMLIEKVVYPLIKSTRSLAEQAHFIDKANQATGIPIEQIRKGVQSVVISDEIIDIGAEEKPAAAAPGAIPDIDFFRAIRDNYPESLLAKRVESEYSRITGQPLPEEPSPEKISFEIGILFGESPPEQAADDTLKRFEKANLQRTYQAALKALRQAELAGDQAAVRETEAECSRIMKTIAALH